MAAAPHLEDAFREGLREYLGQNIRKVRTVWAQLSEEDIWRRPNERTLAPANQLIHLSGNLRQWVLGGLGGHPDTRRREAEFAVRDGRDKADVLGEFERVLALVLNQLEAPVDYGRRLTVQGFDTTAAGVWIHAVEHLSYHTGQLVYAAKARYGEPYDFYAGHDLNATSSATVPAEQPAERTLATHFSHFVRLLATGSFLAAIDRFYAEDIVQYENADEPTRGREALLLAERRAERRIASADIQVKDAVIDEERQLVWGEMDIHFVSERGVEQRLREAFRQNWRDGRIVEQRFYYRGFRDA